MSAPGGPIGRIRDLPLRRQLVLIILASLTTALALAGGTLLAYEWADSRKALSRDTRVLADVLGRNVRAALAFEDEAAAAEILGALESEPQVITGSLFTADDELLAEYRRPGTRMGPRAPVLGEGHRFEDGVLTTAQPVTLNEKRIGTIELRTSLAAITVRLRLFAALGAGVLLASMLVALGLASRLRRVVTDPILALADTAREVDEEQNFSVRAPDAGRAEVGRLTSAFNQMLTGIEERDAALLEANRALRAEVTEREQAQQDAQAQLQRLDLLNQITRAIGGRQDLLSIYQVVVRYLEEALPLDFAAVLGYDPAARSLTVAHIGVRSESLGRELTTLDESDLTPEDNGLHPCLMGRVVYEPDLDAVPGSIPGRLAAAGHRSLVAAPLLVESQVFGVLVGVRRGTNGFSTGECDFLRQLSEHVALAAHQAQLHSALQDAYDDLRQTQQAVMQQERLKALGQMASGIAHDINNAVSPIALYTGTLLEYEEGLSPRARDYLETIQRAIDDVAQTVSRMGEFYRLREPEIALVPVDLNRIVQQVLDLTRARWNDMPQQRGITIEVRSELAGDLPPVLAVESELREALTNLVFNAVDAMPEGGPLTLRTRRETHLRRSGTGGDHVYLDVIDTGVGMDEETRRRCLEPFFTTKGERGTGLGLAMVYGIVQRQGAEVEIETAPGAGTSVSVVFPVPASTVHPAPTPTGGHRAPPTRILVVDDDPVLLHSLGETLEAEGHRVTTVDGGRAAVEAFGTALGTDAAFGVVITDLGMPNVDGSRVAMRVKQMSPDTPVILLTGWGQRLLAEGDVPPDVDEVLSKPPRLQEIRIALSRHVRVEHGSTQP